MRVALKLYASLADHLPPEARRTNRLDLELAPETTIADVIRQHNLPPKMCHLVLVNGHYIAPGDRASRTFRPDDELAIWPPIAGG
jgi:sulfur carrier protein ThiS